MRDLVVGRSAFWEWPGRRGQLVSARQVSSQSYDSRRGSERGVGSMRVITPGRVIGVAVTIVLVGFLPSVISVGSDIIARTQEWWPAELSLQSYLAHLAEFWRSLVGTFAYVTPAGFTLLLVGVIWAVFLRMDRLPWAAPKPPTAPEWTSSILLQEAYAIHGRTPAAETRQAIDSFDALRREDFEDSDNDAALNE